MHLTEFDIKIKTLESGLKNCQNRSESVRIRLVENRSVKINELEGFACLCYLSKFIINTSEFTITMYIDKTGTHKEAPKSLITQCVKSTDL